MALAFDIPFAIGHRTMTTCGLGCIAVHKEANMSPHEYFCHACMRPFSKTLTPAEYAEDTIVCPHCGSEEVEERVPAFYTISSRERA
jgi:DNA-directed RNA polymerase subunit RPC12/RpoP